MNTPPLGAVFARTLAESPDKWNAKVEHLGKNYQFPNARRMAKAKAELDRQMNAALADIQIMVIDAQERDALQESFAVIEAIVNETFPSGMDS